MSTNSSVVYCFLLHAVMIEKSYRQHCVNDELVKRQQSFPITFDKSISIELTILFLYRFLLIGIGNRFQSSIVIDCYRLISIIGLSIDYAWY